MENEKKDDLKNNSDLYTDIYSDQDEKNLNNKRETSEKDVLEERIDIFSAEDVEDDMEIYSDIVIKTSKSKGKKTEDKKPVKKNKSSKNGILFRAIWLVFLTLISVFLAGYALGAMNDMLGIGASDNIVVVDIPENASIDTVAKILKDSGIIQKEFFFKVYSVMTKNTKGFMAGTYELRPNMDYQVIINNIKIKNVPKDVVEISFLEGMNVNEYAQLLSDNGVCEKEEFLEKCSSDDFDEKYDFLKEIKNKSERYYKLEGYLFPDTYEFYKGENADSVIRRFLNNFQKKIIKVNSHEGYDKKTSIKHICEEEGKTLDDVINIASMIQDEAADRGDMYKISSVIKNRLATISSGGISKFGEYGVSKLGIDSTVWYPYKTRNTVPEDIVDSFKSPYDTYNIEGLPPGPICNPGIHAVYAMLKPENTEYYYFCHSKDGTAYYAKTNDEHLSQRKKAGLL